MSDIRRVKGQACEDVPAHALRQGDVIFNPWSHPPVDDWIPLLAVGPSADGRQIHLAGPAGAGDFPRERSFLRRLPDDPA